MNYYELLEQKYKIHPEKPFVIHDGITYTYRAIFERCDNVGNFYPQNQIVFIHSENPLFQLISFLAAQQKDNVPILLHTPMPQSLIQEIAAELNINYLITEKDVINFGFTQISECPANVCMGFLTSGTTGNAKIFYRSYASWVDFFPTLESLFNINFNATLLSQGSFSFTGNLNIALSVLYAGATLINDTLFDPKSYDDYIDRFNITHLYFVPAKLQVVASALKKQHTGIKQVLSGSQLLSLSTITALKSVMPHSAIHLYYGSSELSYLTYIDAESLLEKPFSVGKTFPGITIFENNGELYVDTLYHADKISMPCPLQDYGHLVDGDNHLILEGRKDNSVNMKGIKINAAHIERILLSIEGVADAAVFDYFDNKNNLKLAAAVVSLLEESQIRKLLEEKLLRWEIPSVIHFCDSIPHNNSGKPDYTMLKTQIGIPNTENAHVENYIPSKKGFPEGKTSLATGSAFLCQQHSGKRKFLWHKKKTISTKAIAQIGVFVALLIVGAFTAFPIPFSVVSLTLQTLVLMAIAIAFKPKMAVLIVTIYIAMGSIGLPIFSRFRSFDIFVSESVGFIVSFIPATFLMSTMISLLEKKYPTRRKSSAWLQDSPSSALLHNKKQGHTKTLLLCLIVTFFTGFVLIMGSLGYMFFTRFFYPNAWSSTFTQALFIMAIPFLPVEAIKAAAAILLYKSLVVFRNQ